MTRLGLAGLVAIVTCGSAAAETEVELGEAISEIESVKLGGLYKVEPDAYACPDKRKLMFAERMATGDKSDQNTAQLIGLRDCVTVDEDGIYTRCEVGGFVFPQKGGRHIFSGYCEEGTFSPVLFIRDDKVHQIRE